ncbi:Bestrophin -like protein, partial [Caligus rogercresseyi]
VSIIEHNQKKSAYLEYSYWVPLYWASDLINQAHVKGFIPASKYVLDIHGEINKVRGECGLLLSYDWISFPWSTPKWSLWHSYSILAQRSLGGSTWTPGRTLTASDPTLSFPSLPPSSFFYNGWLKVAEALLNPFGEDDEDFDTNWMVDRNIQLSYVMVDE